MNEEKDRNIRVVGQKSGPQLGVRRQISHEDFRASYLGEEGQYCFQTSATGVVERSPKWAGCWFNLINQRTLAQNGAAGGRSEEQEAFAEGESRVSRPLTPEAREGEGILPMGTARKGSTSYRPTTLHW